MDVFVFKRRKKGLTGHNREATRIYLLESHEKWILQKDLYILNKKDNSYLNFVSASHAEFANHLLEVHERCCHYCRAELQPEKLQEKKWPSQKGLPACFISVASQTVDLTELNSEALAPTSTQIATHTPELQTATRTPEPQTATRTPEPQTATRTPEPQTATHTPEPQTTTNQCKAPMSFPRHLVDNNQLNGRSPIIDLQLAGGNVHHEAVENNSDMTDSLIPLLPQPKIGNSKINIKQENNEGDDFIVHLAVDLIECRKNEDVYHVKTKPYTELLDQEMLDPPEANTELLDSSEPKWEQCNTPNIIHKVNLTNPSVISQMDHEESRVNCEPLNHSYTLSQIYPDEPNLKRVPLSSCRNETKIADPNILNASHAERNSEKQYPNTASYDKVVNENRIRPNEETNDRNEQPFDYSTQNTQAAIAPSYKMLNPLEVSEKMVGSSSLFTSDGNSRTQKCFQHSVKCINHNSQSDVT